jgi:hypothetical protein
VFDLIDKVAPSPTQNIYGVTAPETANGDLKLNRPSIAQFLGVFVLLQLIIICKAISFQVHLNDNSNEDKLGHGFFAGTK